LSPAALLMESRGEEWDQYLVVPHERVALADARDRA
jgi:hypothetical protein